MPTAVDIIKYFLDACIATIVQLFLLVGVGVMLGFLIHKLSIAIARHAASIFPGCGYQYLFLIPGTAVHELSHLLFAVIFGFTIYEVTLFQCDPKDPYAGRVVRSAPRNYIQKMGHFFIGVAPIVVGSIVIYALSRILLGPGIFAGVSFSVEESEFLNIMTILGGLYKSIVVTTMTTLGRLITLRSVPGWQVWLFVYLAYSLSNAMNLSPPDLKNAVSGLFAIAVMLLAVNLLLMVGGENVLLSYIQQLAQIYHLIYSILLFALSLNLIAAAIVIPLGTMFGRGRW